MGEWVGGWVGGCVDGWVDGWVYGLVDGWVDGWIRKGAKMDKLLYKSTYLKVGAFAWFN